MTILTTMPYYPKGRVFRGYRHHVWLREKIEGIDVMRVWSIPAANRGRLLRIVSHLSFGFVATVAGLVASRYDLVVSRVPNVGTDLAGVIISKLRRSKLLLELADLMPDNLRLLGISEKSLLSRALRAYFRIIFRLVDLIAVPGESMLAVLRERGVPPDRLLLWPHAADLEDLESCENDKVRQKLGLKGKCVVLYAGSFSCYYDVPNIIAAAAILRERDTGIRIVLLGTGQDRQQVERMIRDNSLDNVICVGSVSPAMVAPYMQAADIFIHSLVGTDMPAYLHNHLCTKICEYLMVGRPVIAIENHPVIGNLIEEIGAGMSVPAKDPEALAETIASLAADQAARASCGDRARQYARMHLERMTIAEKFWNQLSLKLGES